MANLANNNDSRNKVAAINGTGTPESSAQSVKNETLTKVLQLQNAVKQNAESKEYQPHGRILDLIGEAIQPVDFIALAYPQAESLRAALANTTDPDTAKAIEQQLQGFKLKQKHYYIYGVDTILKIAHQLKYRLIMRDGQLYIYNGAYWAGFSPDTLESKLIQWALLMGIPPETAKDYKFKRDFTLQFQAAAQESTEALPQGVVLINLLNGTFNISPTKGIRKLQSFNPDDFLTYQLNFGYNQQATAPLFAAYLDRVLPDKAAQAVLAEYIGYIFIRHNTGLLKLEKALVLYGTGANGKSVFYEVVTALLGRENTSSFTLEQLTDEKGYQRAVIADKLVNYASEISDRLQGDMFKSLCSGEAINARHPYGRAVTLTNYAKLVFNTNTLPIPPEQTDAYFRRFLIIPFQVTIPENEQDKELHTKIINTELAGVFNWVLAGLDRLLTQKRFTECSLAAAAVAQYRAESDSVLMFLTENNYTPAVNDTVQLKTLFNGYRDFCSAENLRALGSPKFAQRLRGLGYDLERKGDGTVVFAKQAFGG